jgi:hypothetical protein
MNFVNAYATDKELTLIGVKYVHSTSAVTHATHLEVVAFL